MCFDDQILSAYYDGELEDVWAKHVKDHLLTCRKCSEKVTSFGKIHSFLLEFKTPLNPYREAAVLERIHHSIAMEKELGFWDRKLYISKTFITAAVIVFIFIGLSAFLLQSAGKTPPGTVAEVPVPSTLSQSEVVTANDVQHFFKTLNTQDESDEIIIQLPLDRNFTYHGEPQFLKEADFVRGR